MGLDAFVRCNCWETGRTKPPPEPRDLIIEEDGLLTLALPFDGHESRHIAVERWRESACAHSNMRAASEWITNWAGLRLFQQGLESLGRDHFPVLLTELPELNGGSTPPDRAKKALDELAYFSRQGDLFPNTELFDTATGRLIAEAIGAYDGVFFYAGVDRLAAGLDADGFFIATLEDGHVADKFFRATRFSQTAIGDGRMTIRNLDTDEAIETIVAIGFDNDRHKRWYDVFRKQSAVSYPKQLHTQKRVLTAKDFEWTVRSLTNVFEASVEFNHPVWWTPNAAFSGLCTAQPVTPTEAIGGAIPLHGVQPGRGRRAASVREATNLKPPYPVTPGQSFIIGQAFGRP